MKEKFRDTKLSKKSLESLSEINEIVTDFIEQGYTLTLRQLYYQLVSKNIIPNSDKEYSKLSRLLKEGRMAGIVEWGAIEDRLRKIHSVPTWDSPKSILRTALRSYTTDWQIGQDNYLEVWVEKDALSEVVKQASDQYQVPVMVNRGYSSISAFYDTYKRISRVFRNGKGRVFILYLGDHDPSGLDMVRDVDDRIKAMFPPSLALKIEVKHLALTHEQIEEHRPPPNPAKLKDSRAKKYVEEHGYTSWEVDALAPPVLNRLIENSIEQLLDMSLIEIQREREEVQYNQLEQIINNLEI